MRRSSLSGFKYTEDSKDSKVLLLYLSFFDTICTLICFGAFLAQEYLWDR